MTGLEELRAQQERCWRLLVELQGEPAQRLREYCLEIDRRIRELEGQHEPIINIDC